MKKASLILSAALMTAIMMSSCGGSSTDEVKIGNQVWMAENLNVDKFRNGDPIPEAKTSDEWEAACANKQPAWCNYDNDPANGAEYGKLYNWYAVNDPRGLAPKGWHIPSDAEWTVLTDYLGGESVAGEKMKSTSGWGNNGNGTNETGFTALPGGSRYGNGEFSYVGNYGNWWSATEDDTHYAWSRYMAYDDSLVGKDYSSKQGGLSVRCVRD